MSESVSVPLERSLLYSPVAIRLIDAFTLGQPIGRTMAVLEETDPIAGPTDVDAVALRTSGDVLSYPGFGRSVSVKLNRIDSATQENPVTITSTNHGLSDGDRVHVSRAKGMTEINRRGLTVESPTDNTFALSGVDGTGFGEYTGGGVWEQLRYHVRIESEYFEPRYSNLFAVFPYNDSAPLSPGEYAQQVDDVVLVPNAHYPFDSHVPLLRGQVTRNADGMPIENAEIQHQSLMVITNSNGEFTLPVRFPAQSTHTTKKSEVNKIEVKNARGYARALLVIDIDGVDHFYRVFEIKWKDNSTAPKNHEATLTLDPLMGSGDLPENLPAGTHVSLSKFALLIDLPPLRPAEIDAHVDVDPTEGFEKYLKIEI